jgi:hypothetical protein
VNAARFRIYTSKDTTPELPPDEPADGEEEDTGYNFQGEIGLEDKMP